MHTYNIITYSKDEPWVLKTRSDNFQALCLASQLMSNGEWCLGGENVTKILLPYALHIPQKQKIESMFQCSYEEFCYTTPVDDVILALRSIVPDHEDLAGEVFMLLDFHKISPSDTSVFDVIVRGVFQRSAPERLEIYEKCIDLAAKLQSNAQDILRDHVNIMAEKYKKQEIPETTQ